MRLNIMTVSFTILFHVNLVAQIPLEYSELELTFTPKKSPDTLTKVLPENSGKICILYLRNIKGECDFIINNKFGKTILTGHYENAIDTSVKYIFAKHRNPPGNKYVYTIIKKKYFQPLKGGYWLYYDNKGKKTEEVTIEHTLQE